MNKKYWDDPYVFSFESRIADTIEDKGRLGLILEGTYFFPEGGGQPSDRGLIASRRVVDVQEVGDVVVHFLERDEEADKVLHKDIVVSCEIDREYRLHNMRTHSACHVLFGAARKLLSDVAYAGFHIGELGNLYLETRRQIRGGELRDIQLLANECVVEDRPIGTFHVDSQDAANLEGLAYNIELLDGPMERDEALIRLDRLKHDPMIDGFSRKRLVNPAGLYERDTQRLVEISAVCGVYVLALSVYSISSESGTPTSPSCARRLTRATIS